ncbi:MAG: cellulose synthase operon protein YhjQ [Pseudomonadaceae bacterium]|nr:cellulose synthase operon protein YhjQ [Pseudomonadaceae bacterium]
MFKQFGGRADQYQEISRGDEARASVERWPIVGRSEPVDAARPLAAPEVAPAAVAAAEAAPAEQPDAAPTQASAWSAAGLQSLLAKLAEAPREPAEPDPLAAAAPSARPDLSHIRVIAVVSAKGGVGKSTLAANLAAALQKTGRAVLAIDLDPQNALHHHFQAAEEAQAAVPAQGLCHSERDWHELCVPTRDGLFVLPHGLTDEPARRTFERQLESDPLWLARRLADLQLADGALVLLDTPPGPSLYLQQALSVANLALVVSLADAASYTALPLIDGLIASHTEGRADFAGAAYLINQVDNSRQLSKDITQIMQGLLGKRLLGLVHRDQSIGEALAYNRNVLDYDPHGRGCHDILACAQGLLVRLASEHRVEQPA